MFAPMSTSNKMLPRKGPAIRPAPCAVSSAPCMHQNSRVTKKNLSYIRSGPSRGGAEEGRTYKDRSDVSWVSVHEDGVRRRAVRCGSGSLHQQDDDAEGDEGIIRSVNGKSA